MKQISIILILIFAGLSSIAQLSNVSIKDSLCGRKIIRDNSSRILGWYKPEIPGAAYDKVVNLASNFMKNTPLEEKTGLPMYMVTCCFQGPHMTPQKNIVAEHWANNPACIYAGSVQSLAIQYRIYSGDDSYLKMVRNMLEYQLTNGTTPSGWEWPEVPYASADPFSKIYQGAMEWDKDGSRGDGLQVIEPDKVGELGYAYLRFYEITEDTLFLNAAIHCADALALHIRDAKPEGNQLTPFSRITSPWPFRINARNGIVVSEYCSNALDPLKLLDELLRIKTRIGLDPAKAKAFHRASGIAWKWLFSKSGPVTTFVWNGYFEDIPNDPDLANRLQITPVELAKYLIAHPELDNSIDITVPSLIHWVANAFKTEGLDAIKEQTWCYEPMGSHTARYGSACALYYERTGDSWYKDQAIRFLNVASYMTYDNGVVAVGPNWPGSWFSDGYGDYIRHFIDAMAAIPEWAPVGENHLLRSTSVVQKIRYEANKVSFKTFDNHSEVVLRLASNPKSISVSGKIINPLNQSGSNDYVWNAFEKGGVLKISYTIGTEVEIKL